MNSLLGVRHIDMVFRPPFKKPFTPLFFTDGSRELLIDPPINRGRCSTPVIYVSEVEFQEMVFERFNGVFKITDRKRPGGTSMPTTLKFLEKINHRLPVNVFIKFVIQGRKTRANFVHCVPVVLRGWVVDDAGELLIHISRCKLGERTNAAYPRKRKRHLKKRKGKPLIATALTICYTTPVAGSMGGKKPEPQ